MPAARLPGLSLTRAAHQRSRLPDLGLFALWLIAVLILTAHHALWRDEVRALTIALQGDNLVSAWLQLRGEGHPALWYLILRLMHDAVATPLVLPVASVAIAAAAALLLVLYAPFSRWVLALMLFGGLMLFEYSVSQRNYGISVLLLFGIAIRYPKDRDRGLWLGCLLFLLANTNIHSVLLAGAFLLFWMTDLLRVHGRPRVRPWPRPWAQPWVWFAGNATLAGLGVVFCVFTVYPPYNDAVMSDALHDGVPAAISRILLPAIPFDALLNYAGVRLATAPQWLLALLEAVLSALMFVSLLGLLRRPGALLAGLAALLGFSAFFVLIYGGSYRHEGLWLAFLTTLFWIELAEPMPPAAGQIHAPGLVQLGHGAFVLLLILQIPAAIRPVQNLVLGAPPFSRSRDLGALIASRPDLRDATVIAEPESLVEFVPYYAPNPTYMMRQATFGSVVKFAHWVKQDLSLADVLATARSLEAANGKPVLILMEPSLDPAQPAHVVDDGYGRVFRITPDQVRNFLAATTLLRTFGPAQTDETFSVYLFQGSRDVGAR